MILDVDTDYYYLSPYTEISKSELVFSIASDPSDNPVVPVLSQLTYSDIEAAGVGLEAGYTTGLFYGYGLLFKARISRSVIYDGKDQDSDYDRAVTEDGQIIDYEFSRSYAELGEDYIDRYQLTALLQKYDAYDSNHTVSIGIGISGDEYGLRSINGIQTIPDEGPFNGLDSKYNASVDSLFLAFQYDYRVWPHSISFEYQYAKLNYDAIADWNLREDFSHPKSYTQEGNGYGNRISVRYNYEINNSSWLMISIGQIKDRIEDGYDKVFFSDGTAAVTTLNDVRIESNTIELSYSFIF